MSKREQAAGRAFARTHHWQGNHGTTMHRARRYREREEGRDMRQSTVRGGGRTVEQIREAP